MRHTFLGKPLLILQKILNFKYEREHSLFSNASFGHFRNDWLCHHFQECREVKSDCVNNSSAITSFDFVFGSPPCCGLLLQRYIFYY